MGEPDWGYVLQPGTMLPPLMLSDAEIEALVLGLRWVNGVADPALTKAADDALAKIAAVLPQELRERVDTTTLLVGPRSVREAERVDLTAVRDAIRRERKLAIVYRGGGGIRSERVVWAFALGYFEQARILAAWCESREAYRHFRTERIMAVKPVNARYPRRRVAMLKGWQTVQVGAHL